MLLLIASEQARKMGCLTRERTDELRDRSEWGKKVDKNISPTIE